MGLAVILSPLRCVTVPHRRSRPGLHPAAAGPGFGPRFGATPGYLAPESKWAKQDGYGGSSSGMFVLLSSYGD
jgi:hypothetical protein